MDDIWLTLLNTMEAVTATWPASSRAQLREAGHLAGNLQISHQSPSAQMLTFGHASRWQSAETSAHLAG